MSKLPRSVCIKPELNCSYRHENGYCGNLSCKWNVQIKDVHDPDLLGLLTKIIT